MNTGHCVIDYPPDLRHQAEAIALDGFPNLKQMSPEEIYDLVVELRMNLAEHHLQNDALRKACEEQTRKVTEVSEKQREAEEQIEAFFGFSPARMSILDENLRFVRINKTSARLFGLNQDDVIGKCFRDIVPDFAPRIEQHIQAVLETGEALLNQEVSGVFPGRPTEEITWISSYFPLPLPGGKRGVGILSMDISERKRAEEELEKYRERLDELVRERTEQLEEEINERKQTEEQLRSSEALFRTVSELITDYTYSFCVDSDSRLDVEWVYGAFSEITGYSPEEANILTDWTQIIHPDDREIAQHRIETLISGKENKCRLRIVAKDGTVHWMQDNARPIKDEQGRVVRIIGATADISDLKHTEEELRISHDELEEQVWRRTVDLEKNITNLRSEVTEREKVEEELTKYRDHLEEMVRERTAQLEKEIEERKQIEAALRESEGRLDAFFGQVPAGLNLLDDKFRYQKVNELAARYMGLPVEEIIGKSIEEIAPKYAPEAMETFRKILDTGEPVRGVEISGEFPEHPGEKAWWLITYFPITISDSEHQLGIVALDITERKRIEDALRESEERYRTLFNSIDEGFCICEMLIDESGRPYDYRFLEVNPTYEVQTGIKDPAGKTALELVPNLEQYWMDIYGHVALTGEPVRLQQGSEAMGRWFDLYAFRLGEPHLRRFGVLFTDITERKRAEEELLLSKKLLQDIIDGAPAIIFLKDIDGRFILINHLLEGLLGRRREEVKGKTDYDIFPHERADYYREHDRKVMESGTPEQLEEEADLVDGKRHVFLANKFPLYDEKGNIYGVCSISIDISERKRADEQAKQYAEHLRRQTAQLVAANEELETFSYSISHDLRAPLRSIDGFSQALEEDYADKLDEQARDHLSRIRAAAQRMAQLIDDLLQLSRTTRAELHYSTVNLGEQARLVMEEIRQAEPSRKVEVIIQEGISVEGDEPLLRQVLQNLLGNAWKFTSHQEDARIEFGEKREDNRKIYFVRDNGAGFDMQYAENLFVPFRRLHTEQEFHGTGIGLSIVKRIIDRHGGEIWAESEPGKGATFYFTLGE
ncbi:MAG: PAS domain-containing sensor histidine kinase [Candidatus Latescibacterota bacterium]